MVFTKINRIQVYLIIKCRSETSYIDRNSTQVNLMQFAPFRIRQNEYPTVYIRDNSDMRSSVRDGWWHGGRNHKGTGQKRETRYRLHTIAPPLSHWYYQSVCTIHGHIHTSRGAGVLELSTVICMSVCISKYSQKLWYTLLVRHMRLHISEFSFSRQPWIYIPTWNIKTFSYLNFSRGFGNLCPIVMKKNSTYIAHSYKKAQVRLIFL